MYTLKGSVLQFSKTEIICSTDIYDGLTCAGRCDATEPKQGEKCQCHSNCLESNDCCPDYFHICMIIDGKKMQFKLCPETYPSWISVISSIVFFKLICLYLRDQNNPY